MKEQSKLTRRKANAFWKSPTGQALKAKWRAERTGRPLTKNLGRTGPGRTKVGPEILDWQIVRTLTSGKSTLEAATDFKIKLRTVSDRGEALDLAFGSVFLSDQGLPFRDKNLTAIRTAAGYPRAAFEESASLTPGASRTPKGGPEAIRVPETARAVIAWRDRAIRLMTKAEGDKNRAYHNHEVIHTLLPDLDSLCDALAEAFGRSVGRYAKPSGIRAELLEHLDWTIEDVWKFTAENGRRDGSGSCWHRAMCFMWEIAPFLEGRLGRLREADSTMGFVFETLGARYGVHSEQIKRAIQKGENPTRSIPPGDMLGLVQLALLSAPAPKPGPGPQLGLRKDTRDRIRFAAALQKVLGKKLVWKDYAHRLFPLTPGTAESNTYNFVSEHRARIALAEQDLTLSEAEALIR